MKRIARLLMLALVSLTVTLLAAEFLVRRVSPQLGSMRWFVKDARYDFFHRPGHTQVYPYPGTTFEMDVSVNGLGLRENGYDEEAVLAPDAVNVLLLGDSFTFGYGVNYTNTFAWLLQQKLRSEWNPAVHVINAGVGGWGTAQQTRFGLDHLERFHPDVIVLTFCANDPQDDRRFLQGGFDIENTNLPGFPGKEFLRLHSHLYRLLYHVIYKLRYKEDINQPRNNPQTEIVIAGWEWDETLKTIRQFDEEVRARRPGCRVLVQATAPWKPEVRERLASLQPPVTYVDLFDATVGIPEAQRELEYDGHWPPPLHEISAAALAREILKGADSSSLPTRP